MSSESLLHAQTTAWVTQNYSYAEHLVKTESWLLQLQPEASEALCLAALTHDMERAFPGPDSPKALSGVDHVYNRAHSERSARIAHRPQPHSLKRRRDRRGHFTDVSTLR